MKKEKILFMLTYMNLGGTEKAFLNLLDEINPQEYEVTLLLLEKKGELMNSIPEWVEVKVLENYDTLKPLIMDPPLQLVKQNLSKMKIIKAFGLAFWHLVFKLTNDRSGYYRFILKDSPIRKENYDTVIAYAGPMDFISQYVIDKITAKRKVQWIHFDVSQCGFNIKFSQRLYPKFDNICVVSETAREELIKRVPAIKDKTSVVHNTVSKIKCMAQAESGSGFEDQFEGIRILTVGRLSEEKGQDIVPEIVKKLKESGQNIKWYLLGCGNLEKQIQEKIQEYNLQEKLILLGKKLNPYPFYKECDIYVQTSRHEGFCITVAEAKVFDLPIIATDVVGVRDQLKQENEIVVPRDVESMYQEIVKMINRLKGN